jgi:hypothetical protein
MYEVKVQMPLERQSDGIVANTKSVCIVRVTAPFPFWGLSCEGVEQIEFQGCPGDYAY